MARLIALALVALSIAFITSQVGKLGQKIIADRYAHDRGF